MKTLLPPLRHHFSSALALLSFLALPSWAQDSPFKPGQYAAYRAARARALAQRATSTTEFRQDPLFTNPSFEGTPPPLFNSAGGNGWTNCQDTPDVLPNTSGAYNGWGSNIAPSDGQAYLGIQSIYNTHESFGQQLRTPLKAGVTYTFLVDVAYRGDYNPNFNATKIDVVLTIKGGQQSCSGSWLWSKVIPTTRTSWQSDTVTITPTADVNYLEFQARGSDYESKGAVLIDNLRTTTGIVLEDKNGAILASGKDFRLLWQPIFTVGGLDSLALDPEAKGTITTTQGGLITIPANLQVTDARGFYLLKEVAPAADQDTAFYGLYVRNTTLPDGSKDDILRHLYECRTYGSQSSPLVQGTLPPLKTHSLQTFAIPKDLRLASRPSEAALLENYEQYTGGRLTDFDGNSNSLSFMRGGSWTIGNGKARTGTYRADELSELVSEPFRLDTTLSNSDFALRGFALYFDEQYRLESQHDYGTVSVQYLKPSGFWSKWMPLSTRTGQTPGTGTRLTYLGLRDTVLWNKNVRIKFGLQSDCSNQLEGWTVDNIFIRQIVTSREIQVALTPFSQPDTSPETQGRLVPPVTAPVRAPRIFVEPGLFLKNPNPINGLQYLFRQAGSVLNQKNCRLDVTFVIDGSGVDKGYLKQDLHSIIGNNLDQLAQLLNTTNQGKCKQIRFVVAGGKQPINPETGKPFNYTVLGKAVNDKIIHSNLLLDLDLGDLKEKLRSRIAIETKENTAPPYQGGEILAALLDLDKYYGPPEAGVKRVIVVLNNSAQFDNIVTQRAGNAVTAQKLREKLDEKGVSLLVNSPLLSGGSVGGLLQRAAHRNYWEDRIENMLLDKAAELVCKDEDPGCCQDDRLVLIAEREANERLAQAELDAAPACPTAATSNSSALAHARGIAAAASNDNSNILLGNPSGAAKTDLNNYLLSRKQFILSYNNAKGIPNWASWHLDLSDVQGGTGGQRLPKFEEDALLVNLKDSKVNIIEDKHYDCCGFARGHLCASADRAKTQDDTKSTYVMTNCVPQARGNNSGIWMHFEKYLRNLVITEGQEVYVIAGPAGAGGENVEKVFKTKLDNKESEGKNIEVPKYMWKIAVVLPRGDNDLSRINADTRIICIQTPNTQTASQKRWYDYRISIDELEKEVPAGFNNFLSAITNGPLKRDLKSKTDTVTLLKGVGVRKYCPPAARPTVLSNSAGQLPGLAGPISVAPNPFQADFTVRYELAQADRVSISLRNVQGGTVRRYAQAQPQAAGAQRLRVEVAGLPPGLYWLEVQGQQHVFPMQRLLKVE